MTIPAILRGSLIATRFPLRSPSVLIAGSAARKKAGRLSRPPTITMSLPSRAEKINDGALGVPTGVAPETMSGTARSSSF